MVLVSYNYVFVLVYLLLCSVNSFTDEPGDSNICSVTPIGEPPTPRAAHVATAVGTMVVIQVC